MGKRKSSAKGEKKDGSFIKDRCQTPDHAVLPILPYLPKDAYIWECAAGQQRMLESALTRRGYRVLGTEITDSPEQDFFRYLTPPDGVTHIVTNPPYSVKYPWLRRCYKLGLPFALLMPVDVFGSGTAQILFDHYGMQAILLRPRINFHMPNVGWGGKGSTFSTAWFTWGLNLPGQLTSFRFPENPDQLPLAF